MPDNRPSDPMPAGSLNPNLIKVALRLLWRDWQGGELRLLFIALVMAVTSVTGIALFTDRLERALLLESANMLAADRIVSGRGELPEAILAEGQSRGLRTAQTLSFTSMAFSDSGNLLVAAKAVTDSYPLRGEVIITEEAFTRCPSLADRHRVKFGWKPGRYRRLILRWVTPFSLARQSSLSVRSSLQSRIVPVAA